MIICNIIILWLTKMNGGNKVKLLINRWLGHGYYITLLCNNTNLFPGTNKTMNFELQVSKEIVLCFKNYTPITMEDYDKILISCNAKKDSYEQYSFENKEDIEKAIEILEEKYITAIKLMGVD